MHKKKYLIYAQIILGLLILGYIIYSLNVNDILRVFSQIKILFAILAAILTVLYFLISAHNLHFVLNRFHKIPFISFLKSYTYSYIINFVAPAQLGDASIPLFLKKYNVPVELSGIAYLVDKFNTLIIYCIVGFGGAYIIFPDLNPFIIFLIPMAFFLIIAFTLLLIKFVPFENKFICSIKNFTDRLINQVKQLKHRWLIIIMNFFLSFLKWIILCLAYYFAFKAFIPHPPIPEIGIIPILSTLVGLIPITFGGIGTVEFSAIYMFGLIDINKIAVLNSYIFLRIIQYIMASGFYISSKISRSI